MTSDSSYVSLELFKECVPPFQEGLKAKEALRTDDGSLSREDKIQLRKLVHAGDDAWVKVINSIGWIIARAVRTEMERPRSFHYIPDPEELEQAGMEGVYKMMKNADLDKMNSAVNYLMQWVNTYVKRAAARDEAQFGLSASRMNEYRKISAIRAKMARKLGRPPTDEEVYEYAKSGKARVRTFMGRTGKGSSITDARKADEIPLALIKEQAEFEKGYPMKFAVNDPFKIDQSIHVESWENEAIEPSGKKFWRAWFRGMGIIESQWDSIAAVLDLYDIDSLKTVRNGKRLKTEVLVLMGSLTGRINAFAREWHDAHGEGPWDAFIDMPDDALAPEVSLDAVDENGRKMFRVLKFASMNKERNV